MSDREAVEKLRELAKAHECKLREEDAEAVRYEHRFTESFVVGWEGENVTFFSFCKCPFDPPKPVLRQFRHIEKVSVWPDGRPLTWLGWIAGVRRLEIYGWNEETDTMPSEWACAATLERLYLDIRSGQIPKSFQAFHALRALGLDSSGTLVLPDWLAEMGHLEKLLLRNCHIQSIPASLVKTGLPFRMSGDADRGIFLKGATLSEGDIGLFYKPWEVIDAYYRQEAMGLVRECKVIFLGNANAGKTSLIDRIVHDRFQDGRTPTKGVQMTDWNADDEDLVVTTKWITNLGGNPFTLRILDFGGQEIMHAIYPCFLTSHTVYVVVCDSRNDSETDVAAARWLELVSTLAPDCPVILVLNKADLNNHVSVNESNLRERNPNLRRVLQTSAKAAKNEAYNVGSLISEIMDAVPGCMDLSEVNENWLGVKRTLEKLEGEPEPYIVWDRYQEICSKYHIDDEETQRKMLDRFADLGIAYYYGDKGKGLNPTNDYHVLNPSWMANGMYRLILRTPSDVGFLSHQMIREAMGKHYPDDTSHWVYNRMETNFILHVMRKFGLSMEAAEGIEMIPMKLPTSPPGDAYDFPWKDSLHLCWEAPYLPFNLIHRLMIWKYQELDPDLKEKEGAVWRNGGRFFQRTTGCRALTEMNERELNVYVTGEPMERRQYMESFRTEILYILDDLGIRATEVICFITERGKRGRLSYRDVVEQFLLEPGGRMLIPGTEEYISPKYLLGETYYSFEAIARIQREAWETAKHNECAGAKGIFRAIRLLRDKVTRRLGVF